MKEEKIAILVMAAKPYTKGHDLLIRLAATENEQVCVFVSTKERQNRKDELKVTFKTMNKVWEKVLPSLPKNVDICFSARPLVDAYTLIAETGTRAIVYSDPCDMEEKFGERTAKKFLKEAETSFSKRIVQRCSTDDVSGTDMRRWLLLGDVESFSKHVPDCLDPTETFRTLTER